MKLHRKSVEEVRELGTMTIQSLLKANQPVTTTNAGRSLKFNMPD